MMLTKKLACPACHVNLKVADTLPAGKMIRCPKCRQSFPVPDDDDEPPPKLAAVPRKKAAPPPEDEEELEEQPKPRPAYLKKRRKRRKKEANRTPLIVGLIIGGVVLAAGIAGVLVYVLKSPGDKNAAVAQNTSSPAAQ